LLELFKPQSQPIEASAYVEQCPLRHVGCDEPCPTAAAAPEQWRSQRILEAADELTDRGRRHMEFPRCGREALVSGAGFEGSQRIEMKGHLHVCKDFLSAADTLSRLLTDSE
jgi:hypothetical protein